MEGFSETITIVMLYLVCGLYSPIKIQLLVYHLPVSITEHVLLSMLLIITVSVLNHSLEGFVNTPDRSVQKINV